MLAREVSGRVMGAFVRARKPAMRELGTDHDELALESEESAG
jgi:hypothetical protein